MGKWGKYGSDMRYAGWAIFPTERPLANTKVKIVPYKDGNSEIKDEPVDGISFETKEWGIAFSINGKTYDSNHHLWWKKQ